MLPVIKRARGRYAYGADGRRYLDCFLNDGRAILGHRPPKVSTVMKDVISTGRFADYPSEYDARLVKLLAQAIPSHPVVRLYTDVSAALDAISDLSGRSCIPADPARADFRDSAGEAWYWRPFLGSENGVDYSLPRFLLPILPFPGSWAGQAVCAAEGEELRASDRLSPVGVAGQVRALHSFLSLVAKKVPCPTHEASSRGSPARGRRRGRRHPRGGPPDPGVELLPSAPPALVVFRSRGPYLTPVCGAEEYEGVFYTFLENGIIIHPDSAGTSIWSPDKGSHDAGKFAELDRRCADELGLL
jgi:hypothetical protein